MTILAVSSGLKEPQIKEYFQTLSTPKRRACIGGLSLVVVSVVRTEGFRSTWPVLSLGVSENGGP